MARMKATIWHNPDCGTSRKTLAILEETPGIALTVIPYRTAGWDRPTLERLFKGAGLSPREALRVRGTDAEARGLTAPDAAPEAILAAMCDDPILVERPFVETERGVALCRPQDRVRALL